MSKAASVFDRLKGNKPDKQKSEQLRAKLRAVVPGVIKAVAHREQLAAMSRFRELEGVKTQKSEPVDSKISGEDAHKQP